MNLYDNEESPYFDTALICLNGHTVNDSSRTSPEFNKKFCDRCGEPTTDVCPKCQSPIQGDYKSPNCLIVRQGEMPAPGFCHNCGKPFPWTERRLEAAKALAEEFDGISVDEKQKLKQSLDDLVREGPRTEPAKLRFKNIMKKVGKESYDVMKKVVSDIVSETVKKSVFG